MKHIFETKVYYADTDAYGVVWHGTYLRWMEKGRVDLCDMLGLDLVAMKNNDVLLPVANMNVRYKASARLDDDIIIETWIEKLTISKYAKFKNVPVSTIRYWVKIGKIKPANYTDSGYMLFKID